jgi:hypothetical protein
LSIIRTHRKEGFTVIPNDLINDDDLSGDELGMLVFLLSKPADWWVTVESLKSSKRFGSTTKVVGALKRLRDLGYAKLTRFRSGKTEWLITDEKGLFAGRESPDLEPHSQNQNMGMRPHSENPHSENPHLGFGNALQRTEYNKELREEQRTEDTPPYPPEGHATEMENKQPAGASAGSQGRHEGEQAKPAERDKKAAVKHAIPSDWVPDENCWCLIDKAGIDRDFALSIIDEFRLYWQERGDKRGGWNATFLNRVKDEWKRDQKWPKGGTNITPLRPGPIHNGPANFRTLGELRAERNIQVAMEWVNETTERCVND